jgi:hypothetical protein
MHRLLPKILAAGKDAHWALPHHNQGSGYLPDHPYCKKDWSLSLFFQFRPSRWQ